MRNGEEKDIPTTGARAHKNREDLVLGVERPGTGLGDVDVASTMEGLLDREVSARN